MAFTFSKAAVTCSGVAFSLLITVSASLIASCAAVFASLYAFALSAVFPVVGSASVAKVFNASFACVNSALSALLTNNSAALSKAVFAASTFAWASCTSAFVALSPFASTAAAAALASSNCVFNFPYSASYAAILSGVFPVSSAFVNWAASAFNLAFSSAVAASIKPSLACCKATFLAFTVAKASLTWATVASVLAITVLAVSIALIASCFASL